jgi:hypothetical protein
LKKNVKNNYKNIKKHMNVEKQTKTRETRPEGIPTQETMAR